MSKSDLLKKNIKGGLNGLLSSTTLQEDNPKPRFPQLPEKKRYIHYNFIIEKTMRDKLKMLALKEDKNLKQVLEEAVKMLLESKGM